MLFQIELWNCCITIDTFGVFYFSNHHHRSILHVYFFYIFRIWYNSFWFPFFFLFDLMKNQSRRWYRGDINSPYGRRTVISFDSGIPLLSFFCVWLTLETFTAFCESATAVNHRNRHNNDNKSNNSNTATTASSD